MKNRSINLNLKGMTLVESMVTLLIFAVIVSGIYTALVAGTNSWEIHRIRLEVQEDVRIAFQRVKDDLINSSSSAIVDVPADGSWYTTITFRIPESIGTEGMITWPDETIQYLLSSNQLNRQIEESSVVQETRATAQNINTFRVRRLASTPSIVEVNISATKNPSVGSAITVSDTLKIRMRN